MIVFKEDDIKEHPQTDEEARHRPDLSDGWGLDMYWGAPK